MKQFTQEEAKNFINNALREGALEPKRGGRRLWDDVERAQMIAMMIEGKEAKEIGEVLGRTEDAVKNEVSRIRREAAKQEANDAED